MNKTKRSLILASAILGFVSVAIALFSVIFLGLASTATIAQIFEDSGIDPTMYANVRVALIVMLSLILCFDLVAPIMLMYAIRSEGKFFKQSRGLYIAGLVLTILAGPTSLQAILLYISLAINSNGNTGIFVNETTSNNGTTTDYVEGDGIENSIKKLQGLKDSGAITEEEYKKLLIKRLRDAKDKGEITQEKFDEILTKII